MSRENVELIQRLQTPSGVELTALFRDDSAWAALKKAIEPFIEPDCRFAWVAWGQKLEYKGVEGLRAGWLDWFEPWASYRSYTEEVIDAGDRVVVLVRDRGRRAGSEVDVELIGAGVCVIENGKLADVGFYADRREALQAAGVEPSRAERPPTDSS
jgi:hypothetical protein